jgi:hypothetical protein
MRRQRSAIECQMSGLSRLLRCARFPFCKRRTKTGDAERPVWMQSRVGHITTNKNTRISFLPVRFVAPRVRRVS